MKTRRLAAMLILCACNDDDAPRDAEAALLDARAVDAGERDDDTDVEDETSGREADPRIDTLALSLRAWQQLADDNPGPYWYEEENCLVNGGDDDQHTSFVQVDADAPRRVAARTITRAECKAQVNRFVNILSTMPELHAKCASLIARRPDTRFDLDDQGVVRACWVGDSPSCEDNC